MDNSQTIKLYKMAPILAFIASYFLFPLFDWMEATQIILATWISLFTFMFLAADIKMEHKGKANFSKLSFYSGLLSLVTLIVSGQIFVHWYKYGTKGFRMVLLGLSLLVFFIILFKGMRVLLELKTKLENGKQS